MNSELYLIWSEEHGAWWMPGRSGYTRSIAEAGRYTYEEAEAIVSEANKYLTNGFHEVAVALPDLKHTRHE